MLPTVDAQLASVIKRSDAISKQWHTCYHPGELTLLTLRMFKFC